VKKNLIISFLFSCCNCTLWVSTGWVSYSWLPDLLASWYLVPSWHAQFWLLVHPAMPDLCKQSLYI